jgi:hypothetical protein
MGLLRAGLRLVETLAAWGWARVSGQTPQGRFERWRRRRSP